MIGGPERRTEIGDTTGDPGRNIPLEEKEDETESFLVEVEVAGLVAVGEGRVEDGEDFPVVAEVEDFPVEGEEQVLVVAEDVGDVVDLKTEADIRREGKIGDVETVASTTIPTGRNVTSARTPSPRSRNLQRPTPWRTRGTRSRQ